MLSIDSSELLCCAFFCFKTSTYIFSLSVTNDPLTDPGTGVSLLSFVVVLTGVVGTLITVSLFCELPLSFILPGIIMI